MLNLRKKLSKPSDEILLKCDEIGKKFSKNLKSSLKYAISDIAKDTLGKVLPKKENSYSLRKDEFWALKSVSFELRRGECLGLLGSNGAGKSTLLRILSGIIKQDKGSFSINGSIGGIIALGAGFNPILSGRENLSVYAAIKGISQHTVKEKEKDIIEFSELEDFIDAPFRTYSSGMQVRLAFAAAALLHVPDILLIDEVLAVGDMQFIGKCFNLIEDIKSRCSVILVSHSMANIRRFCNRACLLSDGEVLFSSKHVDYTISKYVNSLASRKTSENSFFIVDGVKVNSLDDKDVSKQIFLSFLKPLNCSYAELVLKKFGDSNVLTFFSTSVKSRPLIKLSESDTFQLPIDLTCIPNGNYYFNISFLDENLKYIERNVEECNFEIKNGLDSFSPALQEIKI